MVIEELRRYAAALQERGSSAAIRPLPGDDPDDVRSLLGEDGLQPLDEVVAFFVWTSGISDGGPPLFFDAEPTSVSAALEIRRELLAVASEAALDDPRASTEDYFRSTWLPIGPSDPQLVVDTSSGPTGGHVLAVWWDQPPTTVARTLTEFVERRRSQLVTGEVTFNGDRFARPAVRQIEYPVVVVRIRAGSEVLIPPQRERVLRAADAAAGDATARVTVTHSSTSDIPSNKGLELYQRDLVVAALISDGVDAARITTEPVPLGEDSKPTHHLLGIYLRR